MFFKPIHVRMGINSGELLMDGREEKGEVFSRTIDITGHLQKEAKPDEIMITEETFKGLKEPGLFEEAGYLERDGVKIYRYRNSRDLEEKD
ncbi:MAG: adenylate/guanylate cyclase domain-containing protein [bacterium]